MNGVNGTMIGLSNGLNSRKAADGGADRWNWLAEISDTVIERLRMASSGQTKMIEFLQPTELSAKLDLKLAEKPLSKDQLNELCETVFKYSVQTVHPRFCNQLWTGLDQFAVAGGWITEAMNTSQYTYEVAPVFSLVEKFMIEKSCELIGWPEGSRDGMFCPGGSVCNMYALHLARFKFQPKVKVGGMYTLQKPLIVFTSTQSHYSIDKAAHLLGFGLDSIVRVECDARGRMMPVELSKAIQKVRSEGGEPLMVNATAGTTVIGAFDPLREIAAVCRAEGLWLHCDAAWGGGVLPAPKFRHLVDGIEECDSVTWDFHKLLGALLQCCLLATKHTDLLAPCNAAHASYLFQQDKCYDISCDTGDKSIQCGRKVDAFKFWLMWKAKGESGVRGEVEHLMELSARLHHLCQTTPGFEAVLPEREYVNVCFWYVPASMRQQERTDEWWQKLGRVTAKIKAEMYMSGSFLVGYQPLPQMNKVNFFRMVVSNPELTFADLDDIVHTIAAAGELVKTI